MDELPAEQNAQVKNTETPADKAGKSGKKARRTGGGSVRSGRPAKIMFTLLFLFLAAGLGFTGWQLYQQNLSLKALESARSAGVAEQRSQAARLTDIQNTFERELAQSDSLIREQQEQIRRQQTELQRLEDLQVGMSIRQQEAVGGVTLAWRLAEVEGLLGLAHQHLQVTGEAATAIALMESADQILQNLDDSMVAPVRIAIAGDISRIRSLPVVDQEALYLRLAEVAEKVSRLEGLDPADQPEADFGPEDEESGWLSGMSNSLQKVFSVKVSKVENELEIQLAPEQLLNLKSSVQLYLQQAQMAVRTGEAAVYESSLQDAHSLLEEYFQTDASAQTVLNDIEILLYEQVSVSVPVINAGLNEARELSASYQRGQQLMEATE